VNGENRLRTMLEHSASDIAPGPPPVHAIKQVARRQRSRRRASTVGAVAAGVAVLVIAAGSGLVGTNSGDGGRVAPADDPTPASPQPPTVSESAEAAPISDALFRMRLEETLANVPGWAISDNDPTILHPCGGEWAAGAGGGSAGNITFTDSASPASVWAENVGFSSVVKASDAAVRLAANLQSCPDLPWQTQPIERSGAVLASSMLGVVWIHQSGAGVAVLAVPTADGPPPLDVQVEVADLVRSSIDPDQ
jgi:hypothetical protein